MFYFSAAYNMKIWLELCSVNPDPWKTMCLRNTKTDLYLSLELHGTSI